MPGQFTITYNGDIIDEYDGARDGCFAAKGYIFGATCPEDIQKYDTVGDCVDPSDSTFVAEGSPVETPRPSTLASSAPTSRPSKPPTNTPSISGTVGPKYV